MSQALILAAGLPGTGKTESSQYLEGRLNLKRRYREFIRTYQKRDLSQYIELLGEIYDSSPNFRGFIERNVQRINR
jgi:hypothetical protein|tara:strand:- start:1323 stop:1550 length:228 start_codon:yes stop_codon:yes gene_type:complete